MQLHRPRQWGACWLACGLYEQLELDRFWAERLPDSREGTSWQHILQTLVCYRLIDPGSEWRLHRQWFEQSAMGDLLGEDYSLVAKNSLYRCLDKVVPHKAALFSHLRQRWQDLFGAAFDVLLYDLTSTCFEFDPPSDEQDKRRHGYSGDKRGDCVQVIIALVVTPEGFPLAYEVLPGNTSDKTTLRSFLPDSILGVRLFIACERSGQPCARGAPLLACSRLLCSTPTSLRHWLVPQCHTAHDTDTEDIEPSVAEVEQVRVEQRRDDVF